MSQPFTINGYTPRNPEFIQGLLARREQLERNNEHIKALEALSRSSTASVKPPSTGGTRLLNDAEEAEEDLEDDEDYTSDFLAVLNGDL